MDSSVPNILESVFQPRRCLKRYNPLNPSIKQYVLNLYQMNPSMTLKEINSLEKTLKLPHNKLKDFFKNQKTKARKNCCSPLESKKKSYYAFEYKDRLILEEYFKKNPKLDTETLLKLKSSLTNGSKKKIINWYYYRNKKLNEFLNKSFSKNENNFDDKQLSVTTKIENNQGSKYMFNNEDCITMDNSDETKTSYLTKNILNVSNTYNTFNNNQNNQPYKIVWIPAFVYQPQYSPLLTLPNLRF